MTSVQEFYDRQWKSSHEDMFSLAFTEAIAKSYSFLGNVENQKLLEVGCGSGEQAADFAAQGAIVTVIDISAESLKAAQESAKQKKVELTAVKMNAEQLEFPAESFDLVYINSTLMHVDQQKVLQECSRVLVKGGKLVVIEPLRYAPLVQMYRLFSSYKKMNPHYATLKMFNEGKKYFADYQHQEFYLFSSALLPVFSLKYRWLHQSYRVISKVDNLFLKIFPFLRYGCWVSVVKYTK